MDATGTKPTLLYIYSPPASGKFTVATTLAELTGFSLFHNHLSVDAVRCVLPLTGQLDVVSELAGGQVGE